MNRSPLSPVVRPFVLLCLLRIRPQDLPASGLLLGLALVAHTLSGVVVSAVNLGVSSAVLAGLTDSVLLCTLTVSLLVVQHRRARILQTLTALAGSGAVIGFLALPVTLWAHGAQAGGGAPALALIVFLGLVGWSLAVAGHVLRHALSAPYFLGLVVAVIFYWISMQVLETLFAPM